MVSAGGLGANCGNVAQNTLTSASMAAVGVGLGEWRVSTNPDDVLAAFGLGSCVAVVLGNGRGAAGLVHTVLPDSRGDHRGEPGKYVDTALPTLLGAFNRAGAPTDRLWAVICGGAHMFNLVRLPDIGAANVAAVRQGLATLGIPIFGADTGGGKGRTVRVEVGRGRVLVTTVDHASNELWIGPRLGQGIRLGDLPG